MKTLSLKQLRATALSLIAAALLISGAGAPRTSVQPASHAVSTHTLLADDGQETHGGKGHRTAVRHLA